MMQLVSRVNEVMERKMAPIVFAVHFGYTLVGHQGTAQQRPIWVDAGVIGHYSYHS